MADGKLKLLAVDDDDLVLQALRMALPAHWSIIGVNTPASVPRERFDAAFVDMHLNRNMEQAEGLKVIEKLSERDPHLEIVAISGDLDRNLMESCLRAGASRFLAKPLSAEEVVLTLDKIEALLLLQVASGRVNVSTRQWIGSSSPSQQVKKYIASLKGERGPILIEGESGTGKEIVANLIHQQENRGPFISVNVAALPENLFESELFGHVRGAFTGADQNKMGLAEAAHGGDLFLDEIEALPMSLQPKLLRFLESGEIRRIGSKESLHVQVRVIAATNQKLEKLIDENKFREDLLWRLSGKKIKLPPLRERLGDLGDLVLFFLDLEKPRRNKIMSSEALSAMRDYHWPGNVRELKRVCEQLSLVSPLPVIRDLDVQQVLRPVYQDSVAGPIDLSQGLNTLVETYEATVIRKAFEQKSDIDEVAKLLQISRSNLYKKIKDYKIELKD